MSIFNRRVLTHLLGETRIHNANKVVVLPNPLFQGDNPFQIENFMFESQYIPIQPIGESLDITKDLIECMKQISLHASTLEIPPILMENLWNHRIRWDNWTLRHPKIQSDYKFPYSSILIGIIKGCLLYIHGKTKEKFLSEDDRKVIIYETILLFFYYTLKYYQFSDLCAFGYVSVKNMYIQFSKFAQAPAKFQILNTENGKWEAYPDPWAPVFYTFMDTKHLRAHFRTLNGLHQVQDVKHFVTVIQQSTSPGLCKIPTDLYRFIAEYLCIDEDVILSHSELGGKE